MVSRELKEEPLAETDIYVITKDKEFVVSRDIMRLFNERAVEWFEHVILIAESADIFEKIVSYLCYPESGFPVALAERFIYWQIVHPEIPKRLPNSLHFNSVLLNSIYSFSNTTLKCNAKNQCIKFVFIKSPIKKRIVRFDPMSKRIHIIIDPLALSFTLYCTAELEPVWRDITSAYYEKIYINDIKPPWNGVIVNGHPADINN